MESPEETHAHLQFLPGSIAALTLNKALHLKIVPKNRKAEQMRRMLQQSQPPGSSPLYPSYADVVLEL